LKAYCDGACKSGQCSCAFAIYDGDAVFYASSRYLGPTPHTNHFAEFQGLLDLLRYARMISITNLDINCDSQLVVKIMSGEWKVKQYELKSLARSALILVTEGNHKLHWIKGHTGNNGNELVDRLCKDKLESLITRRSERK
jgi:ribonuclease HI